MMRRGGVAQDVPVGGRLAVCCGKKRSRPWPGACKGYGLRGHGGVMDRAWDVRGRRFTP